MATCKFYLEKPYVPGTNSTKLKSTKCSIYLTFTVDRERRFPMTLDEKIEPKFWDFKDQKVKGTHARHLEINLYLQKIETDIQNKYFHNRGLPFDEFKKLIRGNDPQEKKTLFLALQQFLNQYQAEKDVKTFRKYNALTAQLQEFDKLHSIDFKDLNVRFYDNFKAHLYSVPNPNYKKYRLVYDRTAGDYSLVVSDVGETVGLFDDTVYKYIINLKTFLKWAEKREYPVIPSYKSWEIIRRRHEPISLTKSELSKLQNHIFEWKSEDIARDYLVLQCLTGQRISDIKRFNLKDFYNNQWTFIQKKGHRLSSSKVTVPFEGFIAQALDILQKHNWQLPEISEQKLNKHIKAACKLAGIDSPVEYIRWAQNKKIRIVEPKYSFLSNHTGRKTFITLALQEGLSIEYVMQLTGISEYDTIKHYKGKFEGSAIKEALEKIPGTLMRKAQ